MLVAKSRSGNDDSLLCEKSLLWLKPMNKGDFDGLHILEQHVAREKILRQISERVARERPSDCLALYG
jgi:hypothetical protein